MATLTEEKMIEKGRIYALFFIVDLLYVRALQKNKKIKLNWDEEHLLSLALDEGEVTNIQMFLLTEIIEKYKDI